MQGKRNQLIRMKKPLQKKQETTQNTHASELMGVLSGIGRCFKVCNEFDNYKFEPMLFSLQVHNCDWPLVNFTEGREFNGILEGIKTTF
jgi:hypothetical protein